MLLRTKLIAAVAAGAVAGGLTIGGLMVAFDGSSVNKALGKAQKQIESTEDALQTAESVIQGLENEMNPLKNTQNTQNANPSKSTIASESQKNGNKNEIVNKIANMPNEYKGLYEYELGQVNKANSQVGTWNEEITTETTNLTNETDNFTNFMTTVANNNHLTIQGLTTSSSDSTQQHKA